jgi:transcriptional regulator with XRE-family HTH domain
MSASFDYRKLVDDFVLGDRRLADTPGIAVGAQFGPVRAINETERELQREVERNLPLPANVSGPCRWMISSFLTDTGAGVVWYERPRYVEESDHKRLSLLADILRWYAMTEKARQGFCRPMVTGVGKALGLRRTSVRRGAADVAKQIGISEIELSRFELGQDVPSSAVLLSWCKALDVFLPPHTALVQVIDVSPELLRVLKENPDEFRRIQPDQFESFVANRLDRMGFNVKLTGPTTRRDGGIDIIAVPKVMTPGSFVLAAQVKHHQGEQKTGREAVDRLASWNGPFRLGMLVTNTSFTKDAVWVAAQERNRHFLRLRDFNDLKRWLRDQYGDPEDWREIPDRIELAPGIVVEIPKPKLFSADGSPFPDPDPNES